MNLQRIRIWMNIEGPANPHSRPSYLTPQDNNQPQTLQGKLQETASHKITGGVVVD